MKRRLAMYVCLLLVALLAVSGCSSAATTVATTAAAANQTTAAPSETTTAASTAATKTEITVGFSFNALMNDVFTKTQEYVQKFGDSSTTKVKFIMTSAENDVSKQIADVNDLISQKPDVICICPEDSASTDTMIKACQDAGIPVMIQNRPYNPDGKFKPDTFVGVDAEDQGYSATKAMFDMMVADGVKNMNLIIISGALTDQNSVMRVAGVKKAIAEYASKGAKLVTDLSTDWKPEWLEANLPGAMRANKDANCLYIASDYLLPAAQAGLESTKQWIPNGQKGHVYIASSDVYKEGLAAIEAGYVDSDSLMNIVGMCQTIVDYSVKLANGEKCPEVFIKGPVFDKANYKDADLQKLLW